MSLILTSNSTTNESGNMPLNSGLNLPYQYHNFLANTLDIEPNSEVAVQSVKINKEGAINVNRANNQYYIYVGQTAAVDVFDLPLDWTTSTPMHTFVNDDTRGSNATFNTNEMAQAIGVSMNNGVFHPNLLKSDINTSGCKCDASRNAKMLDFLGFDFQFNKSTNNAIDNKTTMAFDDTLTSPSSQAGVWDDTALLPTITNIQVGDSLYTDMIAKAYPISHTDGTFETNYKEAGALWEVGLTRFLEKTATQSEQNPTYFSETGEGGAAFYDYLVKSVWDDAADKYYLRVYHSIVDPNDDQKISLVELDYTGVTPLIETFATAVEYGTSFSLLKFIVTNEQITIEVEDTPAKLPTTHTLATGVKAIKAQNLKPTATTTKWLYPRVRMFGTEGGEINIREYKSVKVTDFVYGDNRNTVGWNRTLFPQDKPNNMDFWCKVVMNGQDNAVGWPVDSRYMFDYTDNTSGPSDNGTYTQLGLNASNGINASIVMVLKEDRDRGDYYGFSPSEGANAQSLFGFDNVPVVRVPTTSTEAGNKISYISTNIPKMISTNSTFVRLDNFSQLSFNAQTGSPSKILYHLPRFANSGDEFGALYFEPTERTYVKLGNPSRMSINDFSVSLVNSDETLASNLTGKTIVMFHIRKSR